MVSLPSTITRDSTTGDKVGLMGWGDEELALHDRLWAERVEFEENYRRGIVCAGPPVREDDGKDWLKNPRVMKVQSLLQADDGFDFEIISNIVYGRIKPAAQAIGICVGASNSGLVKDKVAKEIFLEGDPEVVFGNAATSFEPYWAYSYGAGRVYVGGNRIRGDGSNCQWQIRANQEHGFLLCDTPNLPGPYPQTTAALCREFGRSKSLLDKWRPYAINFKLQDSWSLNSADDLLKAFGLDGNGKLVNPKDATPVQICSGWGFGPTSEKVNGLTIYKRQGSWSHSMQIPAVYTIAGKLYVKVRNQWGEDAHRDGDFFIIRLEEFDRWVKQAVAMTIGEITGRPMPMDFAM